MVKENREEKARKLLKREKHKRSKTSLWTWKRRMVWGGKGIYRKERRGKYLVVTEEEETS